MFTILHISDLHRSSEDPVDNDSLLAALLADRDRYAGETPRIPPVGAIVVSGDLIQGAQIGTPKWQQSIIDQYEVATNFLNALCERFLDADRSRMVLIPGNHDVCWNTSHCAMKRVPLTDYPKDLYKALTKPETVYRWSWSDKALFWIADMATYEGRMSYYWEFVESFYQDINLPLSIDRTRGFQFFELCDRRIFVTGFDSIVGNDCYRYSGAILPGAVGKCAMALRDSDRSYDLKIAVWHHSIHGPPTQSDYMNASQVQEMIGHGFQLGLHGHQHMAQTQTQLVHLDQSRSMSIISAGSLCAGAGQMPRGVNRQYNLVVIEDDFIHARVHVREMGEGGQFTRKRNNPFLKGFVKISWEPPTDIMGGEFDAQAENAQRATLDAEVALRAGRPLDAVQALSDVETTSVPHARKLMIDALLTQEDWHGLSKFLQTPCSVEEIIILVSALIEIGNLDEAQTRLDAGTEVDASTRAGLQSKIDTKKLMRQS